MSLSQNLHRILIRKLIFPKCISQKVLFLCHAFTLQQCRHKALRKWDTFCYQPWQCEEICKSFRIIIGYYHRNALPAFCYRNCQQIFQITQNVTCHKVNKVPPVLSFYFYKVSTTYLINLWDIEKYHLIMNLRIPWYPVLLSVLVILVIPVVLQVFWQLFLWIKLRGHKKTFDFVVTTNKLCHKLL